jgi:hypothetical protein
MRSVFAPLAASLLLTSAALATDERPGQAAIQELLTGSRGWNVLVEFTPEKVPSDRATKLAWEFYRVGSGIKGRTTNRAAAFNCDFEVQVRDNGFFVSPRARGCTNVPDANLTMLDYDPQDRIYPFKSLATPQKFWLTPQP